MTRRPHGWRGLPCRWCRRLCRRPQPGQHLRYHSPTRHPGAWLFAYPGEKDGHHLWTWLGARKRVRIVRAGLPELADEVAALIGLADGR